jgi:ABC-type lipoprotein export system ATPase subunit/ABC-type transporter Mla maintaining outer membrane lipid asymmetry permease subunit MlaE
MSDPASPEPALAIERLSITLPDGRALLNDADLEVSSGEFVLLVGPSGSGKSTLLKLIAGLDDRDADSLSIEGRVHVTPSKGPEHTTPAIGMVFQNLALFDELTAVQNVQFAIDHRRDGRQAADGEAEQRLRHLNVPTPGRLVELSGGERQRVAVARTLAMEPDILLFDEPTTGLDPYRARAVADLIVQTHRDSGKTVIVVTHDFQPFARHKPRWILIDPESGTLREVTEAQIEAYFEKEDKAPPEAARPEVRVAVPRWQRFVPWLESPGDAVLTLLGSVVAPAGGWRHAAWKLRYLWHYLRMVVVGATALYVAIAGALLGFVIVFFGFSQVPYKEVTLPLLTEEFLAATGYSTFRVLVPLLICVLIASKCGAAVAADVGARRLTNQFEAMRSLSATPWHYMYGNIVIALAVGGPLLTVLAYLSNCYASLIAYLLTSEEATVAVFRRNFFATVWPEHQLFPTGTGWVILKSFTSGILIAALSYSIGARPKASSVDVSRDVGLTIFWASLAVLALHAAYSFVEF